jgi:hypothetical protein
MAEPETIILPMLRDIRAEVKRLSEDMGRQFKHVDQRFDKLENRLESVRQAGIGESVLGRSTRDPFGNRLECIQSER